MPVGYAQQLRGNHLSEAGWLSSVLEAGLLAERCTFCAPFAAFAFFDPLEAVLGNAPRRLSMRASSFFISASLFEDFPYSLLSCSASFCAVSSSRRLTTPSSYKETNSFARVLLASICACLSAN